MTYAIASNPEHPGTYPPLVKAGGGSVWEQVLEYRVWCSPAKGAKDFEAGEQNGPWHFGSGPKELKQPFRFFCC